jgi:hypothetical protein
MTKKDHMLWHRSKMTREFSKRETAMPCAYGIRETGEEAQEALHN